MRAFIQFFASSGLSDALIGILTLALTYAFSGAQKPFDWVALGLICIGAVFWFLVIGLTIETVPKRDDASDDRNPS